MVSDWARDGWLILADRDRHRRRVAEQWIAGVGDLHVEREHHAIDQCVGGFDCDLARHRIERESWVERSAGDHELKRIADVGVIC